MLNLWNDFRKVVKFIDENPWVRPLLDKIIEMKNRDNVWYTISVINTEGKKTAIKRALFVLDYLRTPNAAIMWTNFHDFAIHNALVRSDLDKLLSSVNFDTKFQQNRKLLFHVSYV